MIKNYLAKIKKKNGWFWEKENRMKLVCTDDLDSLLSCLLILMYRPNWEIGGFLDYRDGLYLRLAAEELNHENTIYVDCSSVIEGDKCISNHLTSIEGTVHNTKDINLNSIDGNFRDKDYFEKYNLSTFLLVASLLEDEGYKIDNDVGRLLSICLDGGFVPYYQPDQYKDPMVQERYLNDVLELGDIYEIQATRTKQQFVELVEVSKLRSKVIVDENGIRPFEDVGLGIVCKYLNINTDLGVLDGVFGLVRASKSINKSVSYMRGLDLQESKINSYCITGSDNVSFSYWVD